MAVNYYDQFQPLTYNPMTLQEMLIGPQMMQQKHDQYQALLDQEGLFDVPALEVDKPGVQQWMDKYKENINDLSDQLLRSGYNKDLSRRARQILQEKQQAISSRGYLGRANQAYQQYLKNVEDEKKRLEKGEINRDQYERGLAFALQRYNQSGGAGSNATYTPWASTKAVDLQELVSKYGKEITPQTIAGDLGLQYDSEKGVFTTGSKKVVKLDRKRIADVIQNRIASNPEAMAYMKEREALGLAGPVELQLLSLGLQGAETFFRDDSELKRNYDVSNAFISGIGDPYMNGEHDVRSKIAQIPWLNGNTLSDLFIEKGDVPTWLKGLIYTTPGLGIAYELIPGAKEWVREFFDKTPPEEQVKFANEQIDKEHSIMQKINPRITREDVIKMEQNNSKNNTTTSLFKYVPSSKYELKYQQDLNQIKNGGLPGAINDYYLDGKEIKDVDDYKSDLGISKDNPISNIEVAFAGNGAALFELSLKDGTQHELIRKPQETDLGKFKVANLLLEKFHNNERGELEFLDPLGMPIKMTKWISPEGIQATVTMSKPKYGVDGKIVGFVPQQTMTFNQAIETLMPLVLKSNYSNKHAKQRNSFPN